jgi:hypothetical protein
MVHSEFTAFNQAPVRDLFCNDHVALARGLENRRTSGVLAAIAPLLPVRPGKALQGQQFP